MTFAHLLCGSRRDVVNQSCYFSINNLFSTICPGDGVLSVDNQLQVVQWSLTNPNIYSLWGNHSPGVCRSAYPQIKI